MHRTTEDFIALLKPHYNSAAQYCRALFQGSRDAEDGLQDAIIAAMENMGALKEEEKFRSWFFTIITRTFYAAKRQETKKEKLFAVLKEKENNFPPSTKMIFYQRKKLFCRRPFNRLRKKKGRLFYCLSWAVFPSLKFNRYKARRAFLP